MEVGGSGITLKTENASIDVEKDGGGVGGMTKKRNRKRKKGDMETRQKDIVKVLKCNYL